MFIERLITIGAVFVTSLCVSSCVAATADEIWHSQVEPLMDRNCFKCHGGVRQKSDLDLRSLENILKGGEHGPAIVPGKPEQSRIYQFVQPGADPHMPPDEKKQLSKQEIASIRSWIQQLPTIEHLFGRSIGTGTNWVNDYITKLKTSQKPIWTPPSATPPSKAIDRFIELGWKQRNVKPSALCNDRTFVRRVYLDIAGRIPKPDEVESFLRDQRRARRARLVDALLASDSYATRMRDVFDVVLMDRADDSGEGRRRDRAPRRDERWFKFLEQSFRANRPWNEIVRDLIVARPSADTNRGAVWFLYERNNSHQAMAEALAPIVFGVQIKCAQCHNDPLAAEVEQRHYWGLVAAFNRSTNVNSAAGLGLAEAAMGGFVNFQNLKKESQPAVLAFLNGKSIAEKRPAENEKETDSPEHYVVPPQEKGKPAVLTVPKFSRREALADAVTRDNPMLSRAFVNRIWAMLMGRGLVHPVDQMDARHRPSHRDLLDWLARDFASSDYNIKRLIRNIVLSRAYQLDSRPRGNTTPSPETFAGALDKPLSAEQLFRSVLIATGHERAKDGKVAGHDEAEIRRAFAAKFPDLFLTEYNASLQQAMFMSNSPLLDDLLKNRPGGTTARLLEFKADEARVRQAFLIVFGREPDKEELARSTKFLHDRRPDSGVKQLLWALLTSAEFMVNH